jgi:tetratricopeptide (TPR) repeat protein
MRVGAALLLALGLGGCSRYVVKVDTDPAGAAVTLGGSPQKDNRWSVPTDSAVQLVATWQGGKRIATALTVDRDIHVLLRRDGDPAQIVGARAPGVPAAPVGPASPPDPVPTIPINPGDPSTTSPPTSPTPSNPPSGDPMARAKALADAGQKAYELTDYDEAIANFKQAYELIRDSKDPKAPEILGNILYNLAVVYERSHEVKPDPERLRRARIMYKQFDEQMAALVQNWSSSAEHADVLRRIRALDARIGDKP